MRIGVHPSPRSAITPPLALHVEVVSWFSPEIPPHNERTVIVRVAGQPGTWSAFFDVEQGWLSVPDGAPIDAFTIEAWADRPTGEPPAKPQQPPAAATIVAKLVRSGAYGYGLRLTDAGQTLPPGLYELQLVPTSTHRSPT
jgi:hypothetical protein